jgi:predicted permease
MRVRLHRQRLLAFLAQSRLSQNHWALKLGLSRGHWSEIVNGKHPYPSPRTRERMLEVLRLPFEELFEIEDATPGWADTDFRRAITDRYLIDHELAQGGMGAVYLARDARHGRVVAVKVVSPEAVSGIGVTPFLREISTVAKLQHPHILPLYDSGEAAGHPFYVMPHIRGGSLRARLKAETRLPVAAVARLTTGIAAALEHAHLQRILHCDIKPENILLDGDHPYVMDFGIARKLHTEVLPWTAREELDFTAGTPAYVSPEQASGERELDARSDVYSLACVAYEMLSGRPPFEGTTTEAVVARRFVSPPPPIREFAPEVPPALESAVERAMALEPARRPASAARFAASIAASAAQASGVLSRISIAITRALNRWRRPGHRRAIRLRPPFVEGLAADVRYALRALRRSPAFTAVVAITLALGIGANTAIFSVVRGVLLKPLPHRDGDRLVYLRHSADGPGRSDFTFSVPEVRDFRTGAPSLSGIAEYSSWSGILQGHDGAVRINLGLVTGNFFEIMGLSPVLGRLTRSTDDGPGALPVMVLTHEFWKRRFGGDSGIVGTQVRLDGRAVEVIGVVQPAPTFPGRMDALLNMVFSPHHMSALMVEDRIHRMTEVVARLAPGVSLSHAKAEVATVYGRMQQDFKAAYNPDIQMRVAVIPFKEVLGERARLTVWLLMGAAGFVLIICAANVTNLTLVRGVRRERELAARAALGAGVPRLRRLLLAENLLVTLLGAGLGILVAVGGLGLLTSLAARYSPRANEIRLDAMVLGFTLVVAVVLALLLSFAGSLPKEGELASWVSAGGRGATASRGKHRLQRSLVVIQVAVSVMLLAGAGLLVRTLVQLSHVSTGLTTEEVLSMQVHLLGPTESRFNPDAAAEALSRYQQIRLELAALPGVLEVGVGEPLLQRSGLTFDARAEGKPLVAGVAPPNVDVRPASPEYFRAAGIPLLRGRQFTTADPVDTTRRVVIINQALADALFHSEDPIGKRISGTLERFTVLRSGDWRTVVGVVGNTRDGGQDAEPGPVMFMPATATGDGLVILARGKASALVPAATRIIRRVAPTAAIEKVKTVTQIKDDSVSPRRLNAALVSSFGVLALLMAAVGIAGVLAFSVSSRTNEIGIRMSLGAGPGQVQRMILQEGGVLLAIGVVLGIIGAAFVARVIQGLLFGVAPHDPPTLAGVALMMTAIGLGACWIPALRAARIDPAITMRSE